MYALLLMASYQLPVGICDRFMCHSHWQGPLMPHIMSLLRDIAELPLAA